MITAVVRMWVHCPAALTGSCSVRIHFSWDRFCCLLQCCDSPPPVVISVRADRLQPRNWRPWSNSLMTPAVNSPHEILYSGVFFLKSAEAFFFLSLLEKKTAADAPKPSLNVTNFCKTLKHLRWKAIELHVAIKLHSNFKMEVHFLVSHLLKCY